LFGFFLSKVTPARRPSEATSLILTDDDGIRRVNRLYLGQDCPTDVISFTYPPFPGDIVPGGGEIYVNVERARRIGPRFGGADRELALYIAHGCNHTAGEKDDTTAGRKRMRRRELRWLGEASRLRLVAGLLRR
jgi:probable rRNA maturation factor